MEWFRCFEEHSNHTNMGSFAWSSEVFVNSQLDKDKCAELLPGIPWDDYGSWDLMQLTKNYLRLLLTQLSLGGEENGVLVHCISGWDRTPLFVALLRLTLWAVRVALRPRWAMVPPWPSAVALA